MKTEDVPVALTEEMDPSRRDLLQLLGAGLLISLAAPVVAQEAPRANRGGGRGGGRGNPNIPIAARLHIAEDGSVTVMTSKVECGQGARAEITQAAAEELRVAAERISLIMADTALVPAADGMTAGSRTTPSTVPAVRQACAAARDILLGVAATQWSVDESELTVYDGTISHRKSDRSITYGELAGQEQAGKAFGASLPANITLTAINDWKVLGSPLARPNRRDLVTGAHHFPSDIQRPGMVYGKVLRAPTYGAKPSKLNIESDKDFTLVTDGDFVGVTAATRFGAEQAVNAIAKSIEWHPAPFPCSSDDLYEHLKKNAQSKEEPPADAPNVVKATYTVAYIQHAPLEPRTAVAEWSDDKSKLTVWTATQNPFGVRSELAGAFKIAPENVRVIVPDFGGGFGGKHSGECAVEAARLAKETGKPVSLRWTRAEEFTWAYFRPAGVIEAAATLDEKGKLATWSYTNINSGQQAVEPPYKVGQNRSRYVGSKPPLRHGSYRGLASTANTFARESFMDECAVKANLDPLQFRLNHLEDQRLRAVLEAAAKAFDWPTRRSGHEPSVGVGLACGTEKGAYVAACAQVSVDPAAGTIKVLHVTQAFECGKVLNPDNLRAQNAGSIMMALGPALREEIRFDAKGTLLTTTFADYRVPRLDDLPTLDIHLLDRPDLPSTGAGETPIIALAPAVANAVYHATGQRLRSMPMRFPKTG